MTSCPNGLWVLPKGVDIREFAQASEIELPFVAPRYLIEDVEPDSPFQKITCRASRKKVFDVSATVSDLLESWKTHEAWHTWAEFHGIEGCAADAAHDSEFWNLLDMEQQVREELRRRRMQPFLRGMSEQ